MINKSLFDLLEPGVDALGYELITVEIAGSGASSVLRLYIDKPDGITVDDCARVSDQVGAILDVEDPIRDKYTLEVSSPGFDRPLRTEEHFTSVIGEQVKLRTSIPVMDRKRFKGVLTAVSGRVLTLDVDGQDYEVPVDNIIKARLVPDFTGPEPGDKQKREALN